MRRAAWRIALVVLVALATGAPVRAQITMPSRRDSLPARRDSLIRARDSVAAASMPPVQVDVSVPAPLRGQPSGRIAGRVIDRETGRSLTGLRVLISRSTPVETDLDGRYRSLPLMPGSYTVRVTQIGYRPGQVDSVVVTDGQTTAADFALEAVVVSVEGITVEAAPVTSPNSEASLLAIQQAAPNVSDGISSEAISRSADADAADAVTHVTGISVVDDKFVVVRGLPERYNNTLLNGAELSSPDPNRRVVPLDIFPSSLLESIVATKTATPDRPGDFSGGSVEIRTREFPEQFVARVSLSQGFNTLSTFDHLPVAPTSGWDFLGFGAARRSPDFSAVQGSERFAESFRTIWQPAPTEVHPALGLSASLGGRRDLGAVPFGAALSFSYSAGVQHTPEKLFSVFSGPPDQFPADRSLVYAETHRTVDWGAIANFAIRPGLSHKIAWRNMYTRSAEEAVIGASGYDTENSRVNQQYQVSYLEQGFLQSQLVGEHNLRGFLGSQLTWRGTLGFSRRNEPENRQAYYQYTGGGSFVLQSNQPSSIWLRDLEDQLASGTLDWAVPFRLRAPSDAMVKVGGLYRTRNRTFDATQYLVRVDITQPNSDQVIGLPPDQAFQPENVGTVLVLENTGVRAQPYTSLDRVASGYAMLDVFPLRGVRLVGGARYEDWQLTINPLNSVDDTIGVGQIRSAQPDLLWSGNLTFALSPKTNLRMAAFRSVTRPDAREKSADITVPVAGQCEVSGDTSLVRSAAVNYDLRYEYYRRPGEIVSVSTFYKQFDQPIVETIAFPGGGNCRLTTHNGESARDFGVELEARREIVRGVMAGANVTFVTSRVVMPPLFGTFDSNLPLAGQSPFLMNVNVAYTSPSGRVQASLLFNRFASRITRYGLAGQQGQSQAPSVYERGRNSLDARVQWAVSARSSVWVSGRNLTGASSEFYHPTPSGDVRQGYQRLGVSFQLGFGYGN